MAVLLAMASCLVKVWVEVANWCASPDVPGSNAPMNRKPVL